MRCRGGQANFFKFLQNTPQLCLKLDQKVVFLIDFYFEQIWIRACLQGEKDMLAEVRKSKKDWVRKPQTCKVPHLRKAGKSNQLFKSTNVRIYY